MFQRGNSRRSWTIKQLKTAVKTSRSLSQVIRKLGLRPAGGNFDQIQKYILENGLSIGHLKGRGWKKGLRGIKTPRYALKEILVLGGTFQSHKLKNRLIAAGMKNPKCEICGWAKRSEKGYLPLELDHINGNRHDNRIFNLRVLCPNCHSLTPTHRGRKA